MLKAIKSNQDALKILNHFELSFEKKKEKILNDEKFKTWFSSFLFCFRKVCSKYVTLLCIEEILSSLKTDSIFMDKIDFINFIFPPANCSVFFKKGIKYKYYNIGKYYHCTIQHAPGCKGFWMNLCENDAKRLGIFQPKQIFNLKFFL